MMSPHAAGTGLSQGRRNAVEFSVWSYGTTIKKTCVFLKGDTVILYTLYILCGDENLHTEF